MIKLLLPFIFFLCTFNFSEYADNKPLKFTDTSETEYLLSHQDSLIGKNIDRYLSGMETLGFSGAIVVSKGDKVLLSKGYGLSDRESRRPYRSHTIQTCGSITKQFTAAAILLLESRGALTVHDSITKYFEKVPEDKRNITIHQLLTHSSGLAGGIGPDDEPIAARKYLERLMVEPLQFEPGTGYGYSNAGYSLLGMIVEKVSKQSYEVFLRENLLLPAGMSESGYILPDWERERMAKGYRRGELWGEVYRRGWIKDGPNWHLRANGGFHTTVEEIHKWLKTVQGHGVLGKDAARRWITGYVTENNSNSKYAYGWAVYDHDKWGKVITHNGSNRIFEADFVWLPEKDLFFYIQGNTSMVPAASLSGNILKVAFDSTFIMPPIVETDSSANPETARKRAGTYHFDDGHLKLTIDDTRMMAQLTGQRVFDLMFGHNDEQKTRFAELNKRTRIAMNKLQDGHEDALSGMLHTDDNSKAFTKPFLRRINQIGNLDSLHVIGTFANEPGSRLSDSGPWTTFVYAEFENWNQYWNLVWNEDETYKENRRGPWPTFILIPVENEHYRGVRKSHPWNEVDVWFKDNCMNIKNQQACPE